MECFHPITGYRGDDGVVRFSQARVAGDEQQLRCGRCLGCRIERSREWAVRIVHESKLHEQNSFITLTYDDDHLPGDAGLDYGHFQGFMRRLRARFDVPIRFFACGEYGDDAEGKHKRRWSTALGRPHFHAILFGFQFPDLVFLKRKNGHDIFRSPDLDSTGTRGRALWPFGLSSVGAVSFESAAYVARYCVQKISGEGASEHYKTVNPDTGEIALVAPEMARMSLKPGIATDWLRLYWTDYVDGFVIVDGHRVSVPRFYKKKLKRLERYEAASEGRVRVMRGRSSDNTDERLAVKEKVATAMLSKLKRS